jgi:hypothetical protein
MVTPMRRKQGFGPVGKKIGKRLGQFRRTPRSCLAFGNVDDNRYRRAPVELAGPRDNVVFGVLVEIAFAEGIGIEGMEELSNSFDAKLYRILRNIFSHCTSAASLDV